MPKKKQVLAAAEHPSEEIAASEPVQPTRDVLPVEPEGATTESSPLKQGQKRKQTRKGAATTKKAKAGEEVPPSSQPCEQIEQAAQSPAQDVAPEEAPEQPQAVQSPPKPRRGGRRKQERAPAPAPPPRATRGRRGKAAPAEPEPAPASEPLPVATVSEVSSKGADAPADVDMEHAEPVQAHGASQSADLHRMETVQAMRVDATPPSTNHASAPVAAQNVVAVAQQQASQILTATPAKQATPVASDPIQATPGADSTPISQHTPVNLHTPTAAPSPHTAGGEAHARPLQMPSVDPATTAHEENKAVDVPSPVAAVSADEPEKAAASPAPAQIPLMSAGVDFAFQSLRKYSSTPDHLPTSSLEKSAAKALPAQAEQEPESKARDPSLAGSLRASAGFGSPQQLDVAPAQPTAADGDVSAEDMQAAQADLAGSAANAQLVEEQAATADGDKGGEFDAQVQDMQTGEEPVEEGDQQEGEDVQPQSPTQQNMEEEMADALSDVDQGMLVHTASSDLDTAAQPTAAEATCTEEVVPEASASEAAADTKQSGPASKEDAKTGAKAAGSNLVAAIRSFLPAKKALTPPPAAGKKVVKVRQPSLACMSPCSKLNHFLVVRAFTGCLLKRSKFSILAAQGLHCLNACIAS